MRTYITPRHSPNSYPFQPQEGFLFKDTQIKRAFRIFIRVVSLPFLQNNTISPKIERKRKHFLISWKSDLIYSNIKNKSVKLSFITKDSKHLVQTIFSDMKNKSVKQPFVTKNSKHLVGTGAENLLALIEFTPLWKTKVSNYRL